MRAPVPHRAAGWDGSARPQDQKQLLIKSRGRQTLVVRGRCGWTRSVARYTRPPVAMVAATRKGREARETSTRRAWNWKR